VTERRRVQAPSQARKRAATAAKRASAHGHGACMLLLHTARLRWCRSRLRERAEGRAPRRTPTFALAALRSSRMPRLLSVDPWHSGAAFSRWPCRCCWSCCCKGAEEEVAASSAG
jgi:hypothetical protein